MQATMLPFPYALSCQPYVDITAADSSSRSATPSPPAKNYVNRCYETLPNRFTGLTYESAPRKKSFTIEAILGLNEDPAAKHFTPARTGECLRDQKTLPPKTYAVPSVSPLTAVFTSTADKKESKSRLHHITNPNPLEVDRFSMPSKSVSPNPKSSNSGCGNSQKVITHSGKMKRIRTIFTPEQLERLELEFERQQYMVGPERMYLASALGLSESQVKVWFQNRRIKFRKQHLEMQQARLAQLRENETAESENEQEHVSLNQDVSSPHWDDMIDDRN